MEQEFYKSPLNYTGGKYKLLDKIIPHFPENIDIFLDLFGGGFNVGANVKANTIWYNEVSTPVAELMNYLYNRPLDEILAIIDEYIDKYNLTKENEEGFAQLRKEYNENPNPLMFYVVICYAFNNQIRFNKEGNYNMPFGRNKSSFNDRLRKKFIAFVKHIQEQNIVIYNSSFEHMFGLVNKSVFIYADPPYLGSVASYNEQGGWGGMQEHLLLTLLDRADKDGIKFALSNNLQYKNILLQEWANRYNIIEIEGNYNNCSYHKKEKTTKSKEVLITNY